mmetsp:Transcript_14603/g.29946  ORF Transcript_14603/g.29946 Transcript_14603/m.29946 type:complete len:234 (-) Transcript_14603:432-1133(-)
MTLISASMILSAGFLPLIKRTSSLFLMLLQSRGLFDIFALMKIDQTFFLMYSVSNPVSEFSTFTSFPLKSSQTSLVNSWVPLWRRPPAVEASLPPLVKPAITPDVSVIFPSLRSLGTAVSRLLDMCAKVFRTFSLMPASTMESSPLLKKRLHLMSASQNSSKSNPPTLSTLSILTLSMNAAASWLGVRALTAAPMLLLRLKRLQRLNHSPKCKLWVIAFMSLLDLCLFRVCFS